METTFFKRKVTLIILLMLSMFIHSQDVREKCIDFCGGISQVLQLHDNWCVYACLEAVSGDKQCEKCYNYIDKFIKDKWDNPYDSFMDNQTFRQAMYDFTYQKIWSCEDGNKYNYFGVLYSDREQVIGSEISKSDLVDIFTVEDVEADFMFIIDLENGHCVVFISSCVFNDDLDDYDSHISVMDPATGEEVFMSFEEFFNTYSNFCHYESLL